MSRECLGRCWGWEMTGGLKSGCFLFICAQERGSPQLVGELVQSLVSRQVPQTQRCAPLTGGEKSSLKGAGLSTPYLPHLLISTDLELGQPGGLWYFVPRKEHKTSRQSVLPLRPLEQTREQPLHFPSCPPWQSAWNSWPPVPPTLGMQKPPIFLGSDSQPRVHVSPSHLTGTHYSPPPFSSPLPHHFRTQSCSPPVFISTGGKWNWQKIGR